MKCYRTKDGKPLHEFTEAESVLIESCLRMLARAVMRDDADGLMTGELDGTIYNLTHGGFPPPGFPFKENNPSLYQRLSTKPVLLSLFRGMIDQFAKGILLQEKSGREILAEELIEDS